MHHNSIFFDKPFRTSFCVSLAVMCPALPAAPNSQGWSCSSAAIRTGLPFGTKCRSSCSSGYAPRAGTASEIMCSVSKDGKLGQWTANRLICDRKLKIYQLSGMSRT